MIRLKNSLSSYQNILIRSDIAVIFLGFVLCVGFFELVGKVSFEGARIDAFLISSFPFIWVFSLGLRGSWASSVIRDSKKLIYSTIESGVLSLLILSSISFSLKDQISRIFVYGSILFINAIIIINRSIIFNLYYRKRIVKAPTNLLFIGKNSEIDNCLSILAGINININEIFEHKYKNNDLEIYELARDFVHSGRTNILYLSSSVPKSSLLISKLSHLHSSGYARIFMESEITTHISRIIKSENEKLLEIIEPSISDSGKVAKRITDVLLSVISLIILFPLFVLIFIAVKILSNGPALYFSKRLGLGNKPFTFPKFRTMYVGSDLLRDRVLGTDLGEVKENYKHDPRITKIGTFLRRWSLDEIPQIWSVLKGDMSIVGPRPILLSELDLLNDDENFRFVAKPGLTGIWQIEGRKEVEWRDRIEMEIRYIENWSLIGDFHLIIRTFAAIIRGKGAY